MAAAVGQRSKHAGRAARPTAQVLLATSESASGARLGWTQEETSEKAGLNVRHYHKIEEGSVNPTVESVEALAEAFGVDLIDLLRGSSS